MKTIGQVRAYLKKRLNFLKCFRVQNKATSSHLTKLELIEEILYFIDEVSDENI